MDHRRRRVSRAPYGLALLLAFAVGNATPSRAADNECLIQFGDVPDADKNGGVLQCTDCDPACDTDGVATANGSCTFKLKVCLNQTAGACTATALKTPVIKGRCGTSGLALAAAAGPTCGSDGNLIVRLTKRNKRPGKCKITAKAVSTEKPRRTDRDLLTLVCNPRPAGQTCPARQVLASTTTTTTVTSTSMTAITAPCGSLVTTTTLAGVCAAIVPGQPIANTYLLHGTTGEKRCVTNSPSNRFGMCNTDADCGSPGGCPAPGCCMSLPWVTADGQVMPFSTGTQTTFTVNTADSFPTCEHSLCIPCGNPNHLPCAGIPGCEVADNPNGCNPRATQGCCDQPAFIVPNFFVNILGGLCSRVDQIGCGGGIVNTSRPQTGHNKVTKSGDTSDPGADCCYNGEPGSQCLGGVNLNDDPAPLACTTAGAGNDYAGRIVKTIGGGAADADGIHFRYTVPELSTTWTDGQSTPGTCADGSTYDDGELLISQLILKADTTTSGATGSFTDLNGDGCKRAGAGFIANSNAQTDGPITVPGIESGGPARPQPYDDCSGSVASSVSEVFSGPNSPIRDIGFVAITPNMPAVVVPPLACSCTVTAGCPE